MEHFYQNIPNWFDYPELYATAVKNAPSGARFVEVGVWKGGSAAFMGVEIVNSGKFITFDAIDTFEGSKEHGDIENFYEETKQNLKPLIDLRIVNLIKGHSQEVVKNYADNSIDFVFIDASHEYEDVKRDLELWLPKVKQGGALGGHDYDPIWSGVVRAVNEMLGENNIQVFRSSYLFFKR